jgi:hypothetical protein
MKTGVCFREIRLKEISFKNDIYTVFTCFRQSPKRKNRCFLHFSKHQIFTIWFTGFSAEIKGISPVFKNPLKAKTSVFFTFQKSKF